MDNKVIERFNVTYGDLISTSQIQIFDFGRTWIETFRVVNAPYVKKDYDQNVDNLAILAKFIDLVNSVKHDHDLGQTMVVVNARSFLLEEYLEIGGKQLQPVILKPSITLTGSKSGRMFKNLKAGSNLEEIAFNYTPSQFKLVIEQLAAAAGNSDWTPNGQVESTENKAGVLSAVNVLDRIGSKDAASLRSDTLPVVLTENVVDMFYLPISFNAYLEDYVDEIFRQVLKFKK